MNKKIIALLLVLCMLFALAACGGDSTSTDTDTSTDTSTDASTDESTDASTDESTDEETTEDTTEEYKIRDYTNYLEFLKKFFGSSAESELLNNLF